MQESAADTAVGTESGEQDDGGQAKSGPEDDANDEAALADGDVGGQDEPGPVDDANDDATTEDGDAGGQPSDTGDSGDNGFTGDAENASDAHDRLSVALTSVEELLGDGFDVPDDHCEPLSAWASVEAALAGPLEDSSRQDGGWETRGGELTQFGCGFGWHTEGEGFGSLAVLVSVYASPAELPADFQETSTPAGMSAQFGQGELEDDLVWLTGGPVSAAIAVVGDHELRVTAQRAVIEPEELLAVLDAAWNDLGELG